MLRHGSVAISVVGNSVLLNGMHSESIVIQSDAPQGSVLGQLLFLIYVNDLTKLPHSQLSRLTLYSDDMLLYKPISSDTCNTTRYQPSLPLLSGEHALFQ